MSEKSIKNISFYTKDLSFESPSAPDIFKSGFQPQIDVRIEVKNRSLPDDIYEATVEVTADAKTKEGKSAFIIEVEHAGLFEVKGFPDTEMEKILGIYCPTQIFPYLRQTVDQLLINGGFPPLALAPVNFEQMAMQAQQNQN